MAKIRGQGTVTKLITSKMAEVNRNRFAELVYNPQKIRKLASLVDNNEEINLQLVGFSSTRDYPEQILSILSFVKYVGKPASCIIYSDGSHSEEEIDIFKTIFPFATIVKKNIDEDCYTLKPSLQAFKTELVDYAKQHFLGKRLFLYLNHTVDRPTLLLDSDILFYKKANSLRNLIAENVKGWFLPDAVWGCLDSNYKIGREEEPYQVNAGFILMNKELPDLSEGLDFLKSLNYKYEYFSEQTIMHILLKKNNFMPLDPRRFILSTNDQFDFRYRHFPENIAIRHYTGPIRHKMWQYNWKWHLSIK